MSPQTIFENKSALVTRCRENNFLKRSSVRKFKSKTLVFHLQIQLTINELSSAISKPHLKRKQCSSMKSENKATFWKSCCFAKTLGKRFFHFSKSTKFLIDNLSVKENHNEKQLNNHLAMSNTIFWKKKFFLRTLTSKRRFYSNELDKKAHWKISKNVKKQKPRLKTSQPLLQEIERYFLYMLIFRKFASKNWLSIFLHN